MKHVSPHELPAKAHFAGKIARRVVILTTAGLPFDEALRLACETTDATEREAA